jgi:hypothetical protein
MYEDNQYILLVSKSYCTIYIRCESNDFIKRKFKMTKQEALLKAFQNGEQLTAKQITSRFGIANPTATVSDLRFNGFAVYANKRTNRRGESYTKYRLGTPSRAVVAAGYRAMAMGLV